VETFDLPPVRSASPGFRVPSSHLLTLVVLAAVLLALAVWIFQALRRSPYTPVQSVLYFINVLLTRVLWRTEVRGRWTLPHSQGAVIVCNHRASVDPFFIQLATGRQVHWMVAAEYFRVPVAGTLMRYLGAIPTRRGGVDTASTRAAIRLAEDGELVGMLPEGRINDTPVPLLPARPGAILVALKARVPIVPCHITGSPYDGTVWGCFFMPAKVTLTLGQPIALAAYADHAPTPELQAKLTLCVMRQIAQLGGHNDFEPTLAGRQWRPQQ